MKHKQSQLVMIWFLPLIVIGGLFFPVLGYLVVAMMAFFLVLSFFKGRYWCWNLCPRGAFFDIVMPKLSSNRQSPRIFTKMWFRWFIFAMLMSFLILRLYKSGKSLIAIAAVFVVMCILTTIVSIVLGLTMKSRSWCAICPMGTMQEYVGKIRRRKKAAG